MIDFRDKTLYVIYTIYVIFKPERLYVKKEGCVKEYGAHTSAEAFRGGWETGFIWGMGVFYP